MMAHPSCRVASVAIRRNHARLPSCSTRRICSTHPICTALPSRHYTTRRVTTRRVTTRHATTTRHYYTSLRVTSLHVTSLHVTTRHYTPVLHGILHLITRHYYTSQHYTSQHYTTYNTSYASYTAYYTAYNTSYYTPYTSYTHSVTTLTVLLGLLTYSLGLIKVWVGGTFFLVPVVSGHGERERVAGRCTRQRITLSFHRRGAPASRPRHGPRRAQSVSTLAACRAHPFVPAMAGWLATDFAARFSLIPLESNPAFILHCMPDESSPEILV